MSTITRRDFLAGLTAAAGAATLATPLTRAAESQAKVKSGTDLVELGKDLRPDAPGSELEPSIEKVRTSVLVVEAAPGVKVHVEQLRHEFWFGAALVSQFFSGRRAKTEDAARYKKAFLENFNAAVTENALKWRNMERRRGEVDYSTVERDSPVDQRARHSPARPQHLLGSARHGPTLAEGPRRHRPPRDAQGAGRWTSQGATGGGSPSTT